MNMVFLQLCSKSLSCLSNTNIFTHTQYYFFLPWRPQGDFCGQIISFLGLSSHCWFLNCVRTFSDVPSNPYGVRVLELSQTTAKVSFNKPDSHGGVPIHHYQVDVKEVASETWRIVHSHGVQSEYTKKKSVLTEKNVKGKIL